MRFLILNVLLITLAGSAWGAAIENCHFERLTGCGDPLAEFRKEMGQSFPVTEEQVKNLCDKMAQGYQCAEEYEKKCMTPLQIQTMGFLTEGSQQAYKDFCQEGSQTRTDYLKHAKCMDESSKSDESRDLYSYVEASLEDLNEKPNEEKLTSICCGYQWLTFKSDKMGAEKCGEDAVKAFRKVVDMAMSTLPDMLCSGFEPEGSKCAAVLAPPGSKPQGSLRHSHVAQSFMSLYFPDVKVE